MQQLHPTKAVIALVTVPATAGAAWLTAAVGKYGVHLSKSGVAALAIAGAASAVTLGVKLIHDVEAKHPGVARAVADVAELDPSLAGELGLTDGPNAHPPMDAPTVTQPAVSGWPPSA